MRSGPDVPTSYLGYYPVGAFLVRSRQALGPLVTAARQRNRLKTGRNVTVFDTARTVVVNRSGEPAATSPPVATAMGSAGSRPALSVLHVDVPESAGEARQVVGISYHEVVAATDALQDVAHLFSCGDVLFAVHVTGAWSDPELAAMLLAAPSSGGSSPCEMASQGPLALAYVRQLRVFSSACFSPALEDKAPTPSAVAFSALQTLALAPHGGDPAMQQGFTFSELFGGIGMFRLGLERAGGTASFAVELAPVARTVYEANYSCSTMCPLAADITEIPSAYFPPHEVLTAGFPCQSFAKAGPAVGLRDTKGWLFYEVVRVLAACRPRVFLLENVANLVDVEEGAQLQEILACLRRPAESRTAAGGQPAAPNAGGRAEPLAYTVGYRVIDGGIITPQTRRRVYFIGVREDAAQGTNAFADGNATASHVESTFDKAEEKLAAMSEHRSFKVVRDVLEPQQDLVAYGTENPLALTHTQWETVRRSHTFRRNPAWRLVDLDGHARTLLGSYRTSYQLYSEFVPFPDAQLRQPKDALVRHLMTALSATPRDDSHAGAEDASPSPPLRFFSHRECARLQGIPDTYRFSSTTVTPAAGAGLKGLANVEERGGAVRVPPGAIYKLIGNAVNPLVIECLGRSIAERILAAAS